MKITQEEYLLLVKLNLSLKILEAKQETAIKAVEHQKEVAELKIRILEQDLDNYNRDISIQQQQINSANAAISNKYALKGAWQVIDGEIIQKEEAQ